MNDMTIDEFGKKHNACPEGLQWAKENCKTGMMSEAWEKLKAGARANDHEAGSHYNWVLRKALTKPRRRMINLTIITNMPMPNCGNIVSNCGGYDVSPLVGVAFSFLSEGSNESDLRNAYNACEVYFKECRSANDVATMWALRAVQSCLISDFGMDFIKLDNGCSYTAPGAAAYSAIGKDVVRKMVAENMTWDMLDDDNKSKVESQYKVSARWIRGLVENIENPFL